MKKLIIVEPNTLSPKDKEKITKSGMLVIEHPYPNNVRIVEATEGIDGNMILMSAMDAISRSSFDDVRVKFAIELARRLKAEETKKQQA